FLLPPPSTPELYSLSLHDALPISPVREKDKPFLMAVEDVFSIKGRGTVVTGRIERGVVKINEEIEIVGIRPTAKSVVTGIEMFQDRKSTRLNSSHRTISYAVFCLK